MAEDMNGTHPDAAELQSHADGEALDGRVEAHLESCAACRAEVVAIRRVTAALSLGSRAPDSLTDRIHEQRAAARETPVVAIRRQRMRTRNVLLPVGLAAAALLVVFAPRALRQPTRDEPAAPTGAKGPVPVDTTVDELLVTETGPMSIESISWDIGGAGVAVELRYRTGLPESPRAARLAERVATRLREAGIDSAAITVLPVGAQRSDESLPAGAVSVRMRTPAP